VEILSIAGEPRGSVAKVPFAAAHKFENVSYDLIGNPEAVDADTRKLTGNEAEPFPTEAVMVKQCIENARPRVQDIILDSGNRYIN